MTQGFGGAGGGLLAANAWCWGVLGAVICGVGGSEGVETEDEFNDCKAGL